jgi:hypothetical protein
MMLRKYKYKKKLTGVGSPSVGLHPDSLLADVLVHDVHPALPKVVPSTKVLVKDGN